MRRAVLALSRKRTCPVCLGALVPGGRPDTCVDDNDPVELAARNAVRCPTGGFRAFSGLTVCVWSTPPVRGTVLISRKKGGPGP
jgi:hypothetical protein